MRKPSVCDGKSRSRRAGGRGGGKESLAGVAGASYFGRMKTLSVKLPEPLAKWLLGEARQTRRSRSALVREALEAKRCGMNIKEHHRSLAEALLARGGPFEGPGDLNSNPKYWADFGK
jgi:predicted transcriptional regulator